MPVLCRKWGYRWFGEPATVATRRKSFSVGEAFRRRGEVHIAILCCEKPFTKQIGQTGNLYAVLNVGAQLKYESRTDCKRYADRDNDRFV